MPNPTRPRLYQPRTRAEVAAPLTAVEDACKADPDYLASVAEIVGRVLREAIAVTDETVPPGEGTEARSGWRHIIRGMKRRATHV